LLSSLFALLDAIGASSAHLPGKLLRLKLSATFCGCLLICSAALQGQSPQPSVEELWAQANAAQQAQQYLQAASIYRRILVLRPGMTEAEVNLGLMLHLAGNLNDAIACFEHVLALHPDLFAPNFLTGMDYLKLDNPGRALPYLERATREKPDQLEARIGLANSFLQLGRLPQALDEFTRVTRLNEKSADAWYGLGATYLSMEKEIEGDLRRTSSPYRSVLLGESYLQQGQNDRAVATLSAAAAVQPAVPCAHSILGFAFLRSSKLDDATRQFQLDWDSQKQEGCLLAKLGMASLDAQNTDAAGALRELGEAAQIDATFVRTNSEWFLSDLTKAGLGAQTRVILDNGHTADAEDHGRLPASALMKKGRYSACSAALAGDTTPTNLNELRLAALCSYYSGRDDLVLSATGKILMRSANDPEALYWRIQSMERAGLSALTQGSELNPESASLHALLADMMRAKGDLTGAAAEYRQAIAAKPDFLAARLGLARDLYSDHKTDDAEREVQYVLNANPSDPEANYLMGEILVNRVELADALPFLLKALDASTEEIPYVHADLSRVYEDRGDVAQAIAELKQAVLVDVDGSYYYRLGHLYMKSGDRVDATAALDQAEKLRHATDAASLYEKPK
jgi:tetratricopeptide (TPR) repeat protein